MKLAQQLLSAGAIISGLVCIVMLLANLCLRHRYEDTYYIRMNGAFIGFGVLTVAWLLVKAFK
jgi:hypothetical protein